jgi:IS1 family transposase
MRISGVDQNTIMKMLVLAGERCEKVMGKFIVNVPVKDVECDEIWAFVQKKEAHKGPEEAHDDSIGDAYCFVAIERHTKLVLNFALGRRSVATTQVFIEGLRHATSSQRFQITTDGFAPYRAAICDTLGDRVDFAQLIKVYRAPSEGEGRYSPAEVASTEVVPAMGNPDPARIYHDVRARTMAHNLGGRFNSVHFRQSDIHEDQIRVDLLADPNCVCAIPSFSDDLELSGLFKNGLDSIAQNLVVVDKQNTVRHSVTGQSREVSPALRPLLRH